MIILVLVLANGAFAGAEIAVVSLRRSRLDTLVTSGSRSAMAVQALRENPERFLATVQIGITVIGVVASAFGGARLAADLKPWIRRVSFLTEYADSLALATVVVLVSFLSLVVGELIPKSLGLRFAERYALVCGRPLVVVSLLVRPLVYLLTASSNLVLRFFGDATTFMEARLSSEELRGLVDEAKRVGSVDPGVGEIASRALGFAELYVTQIMIPRSRVITISRHASDDELRRVVLEKGHNRMPVHEDTQDNIVGYVSVKDVIALAWQRQLIVLEDIIRPGYFIVETMRAVDLLRELQKRRMQLAIVVDDHGKMSGIVTMEDLVEELVGEILSEHDTATPPRIIPEPGGSFLVHGQAPVRHVNRTLELSLPESEEYSTLAGLCIYLAGRIPIVGERLVLPDGTELEIVEASPSQIRSVRLRSPARVPES